MDTIYALATARGKAGVAVIRVSGAIACQGLQPLIGSFGSPRQMVLRAIRDGKTLLDQGLVVHFTADSSFTGEEVVELHLHGSQATVLAVLHSLSRIDGFRPAQAGEFTRRALENGKLDLSQVEGLADLLEAETEAQRRQAMRVFDGALGRKVGIWRRDLLRAAALLEAVLDFADEDVPVDVRPEVIALVDGLLHDLRQERAGYAASERIRDGFEVAIIGAPNAGKSTLLNRLAGRDAALTSEYAGTTRDIIEVRMDLGGLPVTLLDTAGLRETADPVEGMGIARARARAEAADLRIHLLSSDHPAPDLAPGPDDLIVHGKSDLEPGEGLRLSGLTGAGVDTLVARITEILGRRSAGAGTIIRARHLTGIEQAIVGLEQARHMVSVPEIGEEMVAESLRTAMHHLDDLVGRIGVEDLLGEIFSSFCIGK